MMTWGMIIALVAGTWATRVVGLLLGGLVTRSEAVSRLLAWAPLAMMSALVIVSTAATVPAGTLVGPETLGLGAGLIAAWLRAPFLVTFLSVVGTTVFLRAVM